MTSAIFATSVQMENLSTFNSSNDVNCC